MVCQSSELWKCAGNCVKQLYFMHKLHDFKQKEIEKGLLKNVSFYIKQNFL